MKRRYKLLIIIFISFLLVYFIYFGLKKEKEYFINIYNPSSIKDYNYIDYLKEYYNKELYYEVNNQNIKLDFLINKFERNFNNINYYVKNAKFIIIDVGVSELYLYKNINEQIKIEYLTNLYILFNKIRKLTNSKVVFIQYFDNEFINNKIKSYCNHFDILFVDYNYLKDDIIYLNNKAILNYSASKKVYEYIKSYVNS